MNEAVVYIYQTNSIVKPIKDMLITCPFLMQYNMTIDTISYETFGKDQSIPDQGLIGVEYAKIDAASINVFSVNTSKVDRVFSFRFIQEKKADYADTSDFLTNFIEWLDMMQQHDLSPKFSYERKLDGSLVKMTHNDEHISAANASLIAENEGLVVYNVDIHVRYFIKYESKGRCY